MNATISVICYKSKTLSNGEHPLMLRVIKNRKISYKSLKVSVNAKFWDFDKNEPKANCPNKDLINKIILQTKLEYQSKILEKKPFINPLLIILHFYHFLFFSFASLLNCLIVFR